MQTTILSILIVVIMMRMPCASLCNYYENVDKSIKKHLSSWRKESVPRQRQRKWCHGNDNGNGATATNPKMMPRQHIGSDNSVEILVQKDACECAEQAKDGGMIPATGFPRISGM